MALVALQTIFQDAFPAYEQRHALPAHVRRAAHALMQCRTAALGGHVQACPDGHMSRIWYNSCRHRSCPQCTYLQTERWLALQQARLLACDHYHVIFTLPHDLNALWLANRPVMTTLFLQAVRDTLGTLLADPKYLGAQPGIIAALLGCGVITGVGAVVNAAKVKMGSSVAVFGCGGIGLNAVQGARMVGALKIIAVDVAPQKLEYAQQMGATHLVNAAHDDPVAAIKELTGGRGVDYAFEAIGLTQTIEQAYAATRKMGICVVIGVTRADVQVRINANDMVYAEKTLMGSLYGSSRPRLDILNLIEMHQAGKLLLDELLTRTYPLEDINTAYAALERGEVARSLVLA